MAEGARLESVYALIAYRGFESLLLRHPIKRAPKGAFFIIRQRKGQAFRTPFDPGSVVGLPRQCIAGMARYAAL